MHTTLSTRALPRPWVWLQLLAAWLPVWALYTALIVVEHQPTSTTGAAFTGARAILPAAFLGLLVHRLAKRMPWPRPFRNSFALAHLLAAPMYALSWILLAGLIESVIHGGHHLMPSGLFVPFLILGMWLYAVVAGISYAIASAERAGVAETVQARMQLAALRAQLHPHFLFNALHTVVQLIPSQPTEAVSAAEKIASLLRTTIEEDRDLIPFRDEWAFVSRYIEVERIRFGERLRTHVSIDESIMDALVPSFALQTLVENAVQHGAAPRVEATDITIEANGTPQTIAIRVMDNGAGVVATHAPGNGYGAASGSGLSRLRGRLAALYGKTAVLIIQPGRSGGFTAALTVPRGDDDE